MNQNKETEAMLETEFSAEAQDIFEQTYLTPLDGSSKPDLYTLPIERNIHGAQHASNTAALVRVITNFLRCEPRRAEGVGE